MLRNAPCSLADLYRSHHAKMQQQERPLLKRKAQDQLPDLRESTGLAIRSACAILTACVHKVFLPPDRLSDEYDHIMLRPLVGPM